VPSRDHGLRSRALAFCFACVLPVAFSFGAVDAGEIRQRGVVTKASWYGRAFKNKPTASGIPFDPEKFTGAHPSLPLGSHVRVTESREGRSVVVKIVDRGPFVAGRGIDLSYAAARGLNMVERGVARVSLETIADPNKPPILTSVYAHRVNLFARAIER
jgi:rare lipoprotein A